MGPKTHLLLLPLPAAQHVVGPNARSTLYALAGASVGTRSLRASSVALWGMAHTMCVSPMNIEFKWLLDGFNGCCLIVMMHLHILKGYELVSRNGFWTSIDNETIHHPCDWLKSPRSIHHVVATLRLFRVFGDNLQIDITTQQLETGQVKIQWPSDLCHHHVTTAPRLMVSLVVTGTRRVYLSTWPSLATRFGPRIASVRGHGRQIQGEIFEQVKPHIRSWKPPSIDRFIKLPSLKSSF